MPPPVSVPRFVKICGVTSVGDARACAEAGADAVGLNFWVGSKRCRPIPQLLDVARSVAGRVERWGVFVNARAEEIERLLATGDLDVAQLHGSEDDALIARLEAGAPGRIVRAVRAACEADLAAIDRAPGDRVLVDAPSAGFGGSGQLLDEAMALRAVARAHAAGRRVVLAGGLSPENVGGVVARVAPDGVDVASGVEASPGVKDRDRVFAFVRAARGAIEQQAAGKD